MHKRKYFNLHLYFGLLLILAMSLNSCLLSPQSKRGTVVDNELRVGKIFLAGGEPAANARIRVIPVGHVPVTQFDAGKDSSKDIYATRTNDFGKYTVEALPEGEYNILAELSGKYAFQDSVFLNATTQSIDADTLEAPGSLTGVVVLQPNHDPRSTLVQVLGTNTFANVDAQGRFRLSALGDGRYTLRVITTLPEYASLSRSLTIVAGKKDSLPDTLRLQYFGIPVVQGLKASYDTARALVTLSWNSVDYRDFSEFFIYRDEFPALTLSQAPIGLSIDTIFQDSLLNSVSKVNADSANKSKKLEYRVRVKNKSDQIGFSYGHVTITSVPSSQVITLCSLKVDEVVWDATHQTDSVSISVKAANPARNLKGLSWAVGSQKNMIMETLTGNENSIQRTFKFGWSNAGAYQFYLGITDASGALKLDSLYIPGNSPPRINPISDTSIQVSLPFQLSLKTEDKDGDKLSFKIKNLPRWAIFDPTTGALRGTPEISDLGEDSGIVIFVSDSRRTVASTPFKITVVNASSWTKGVAIPNQTDRLGSSAISFSEKIFLFNGPIISVFDTVTNSWMYRDSSVSAFSDYAVAAIDSVILCVKPYIKNVASSALLSKYNPATKLFYKVGYTTEQFEIYGGAFVDGVFYAIGNGQVWSFTYATETWQAKKPLPPNLSKGLGVKGSSLRCAAGNGKILVTGLTDTLITDAGIKVVGLSALYDPAKDSWSDILPIRQRYSPALAVVGSNAYLLGGKDDEGRFDRVEVFDFVSKTWSEKPPMPQGISSMAFTVMGTKIYLFLGQKEDGQITNDTWIFDPTKIPMHE